MPQVFQQTLWVGGTGQQGEGQEVVRHDVKRRTGLERAPSFFVFSYVRRARRNETSLWREARSEETVFPGLMAMVAGKPHGAFAPEDFKFH
jgi:hypothetical protein